MKNKESQRVLLFLLAFLLLRIVLIFCSPWVYHEEEWKQMPLGIHILKGKLELPFWCYLDSPHSGGSIFTALLLIPFYILFGQRYLALKLSALTFSLLTLFLILRLLSRHYSLERATLPVFALFIFSTPHYLQKSLFLTGNTVEFLFLTFLFLFYAQKVILYKEERKWSYFLLGGIAGLTLWVQYLFIIFLLFFLGSWFWEGKTQVFRFKFWQFWAGFALGFSPWLIYNLLYGFPSIFADNRVTAQIMFNFEKIDFLKPIYLLERLKELILIQLPRSFHFQELGILSPKMEGYFLYFLFWMALAGLIFSKRNALLAERKFISFWILAFVTDVLLHSFLKFPIGLEPSQWGSLNAHFEFYLLFFQPIMFFLISLAYAQEVKNLFFGIFRWGLRLFFPLAMIQYLLLLDFSQLDLKFLIPLAGLRAYSNAYESGYNFALDHTIWRKVLSQIKDPELRESYLRGSIEFWEENLKFPFPLAPREYLELEVSSLSKKERELFSHLLSK